MENQLLIQFPEELFEQISQGIDSGKLPMINLHPVQKHNKTSTNNKKPSNDEAEYQREFKLHIAGNDTVYRTKLMDLPCIIESQKTYNKNLYFKTGDISQMLVVEDQHNTDTHRDRQYVLDSGITPPSSDIRERWSHVRPICHHDDVDINDYCSKCHNIPRGLIYKVSKEIYDRMHGQPSELWELITTEEWIEVTDDDDDEDEMNADLDRKLKNSSAINLNEWEESEDEDNDIEMKHKKNIENNIAQKLVKKESVKREEREKHNDNRNVKKTRSMNRIHPSSSTRSDRLQSNSVSRRPLPSSTRSVSRPIASAQPPLPMFSSQRRSTPRRTTTPRRNTPLISTLSASSNNLIKGNAKTNSKDKSKNNREKKELEQLLKTKQIELKKLEEKFSKQRNRKMKMKAGKAVDAMKNVIVEIETKMKRM